MAIHVSLLHQTTYTYSKPVELSPHVIRLRPAPHSRTPVLAYSLKVEPADHFINWQQDPFGNYLARLVFPNPVKKLSVSVEVIAHEDVAYYLWKEASLPALSAAQSAQFSGQPPLTTPEICHTALCVEAREGQLFVFLPPLANVFSADGDTGACIPQATAQTRLNDRPGL